MTTTPGRLAYTAEPPGEHITGERDTDLSTKSGQERYLVNELGVTYPQAKQLIRAYQLDQRDADARRASREEFGPWMRRRGDLILMRSRPRASSPSWRVVS